MAVTTYRQYFRKQMKKEVQKTSSRKRLKELKVRPTLHNQVMFSLGMLRMMRK